MARTKAALLRIHQEGAIATCAVRGIEKPKPKATVTKKAKKSTTPENKAVKKAAATIENTEVMEKVAQSAVITDSEGTWINGCLENPKKCEFHKYFPRPATDNDWIGCDHEGCERWYHRFCVLSATYDLLLPETWFCPHHRPVFVFESKAIDLNSIITNPPKNAKPKYRT